MMATTNSISRTVRLCRWTARVNSLWMWVYCVLALTGQAYLLYRAVTRCKEYNELSWRTEDKPVVELYVYITLIVVSVMCVPFFIITSIFKVNNFAGDGVRLGRDNIHEHELAEAASAMSLSDPSTNGSTNHISQDPTDEQITTEERKDMTSPKTSAGSRMQTAWRHIGPFSQGFHVVSAFSLLLPSFLLEAQEIKYGFQNPDAAWGSELDILFGRPDWQNKPVVDTSQVRHSQGDVMTNATARVTTFPKETSTPISPEYINYVFALVVYVVRYAAVFWYTKMSFSFVFILEMLVITVHFAFSFCGVAILYKFQVNLKGFVGLDLVLPARATLILFLLGNAFLLLSTSSIFFYGFQHYSERWSQFLKAYAPAYFQNHKGRLQCQGYSPHIMATVLLLLVICCRGAIVYDCVTVYRKTGFPVILGCIVLDAIYMISWIALWFVLTLKHTWSFRIMFARYVIAPPMKGQATGKPSKIQTKQPSSRKNETHNNNTSGPDGPNGHTVVADVEMADGAEPQGNGSGGIRKMKNRRSTSSQKVTFDKSAEDDTKSESKKAKKKRATKDNNGESGPHTKVSDTSDEYITESTPENTLTRKYRHSIRDKCGQYYRISRDSTPPPAAQSSPRLSNSRQDKPVPLDERLVLNPLDERLVLNPLDERLVLNPLDADRQYSTKHACIGGQEHLSEEGGRAGPHSFSPDGVPLRYPPVHTRDSSSLRQADTRYSYPLTSSSGSWGHGPYDSLNNTPQKYLAAHHGHPTIDPHVIRHSLQLEHPANLPSVHEGNYNNQHCDSLQNQRSPQHREFVHSHKHRAPDIDNKDPTRSSTPPRPPRHRGSGRAARELRFMSKKPDLSHRDSALPSSNETSSNDSNDVLCSQV